MADRPCTPRIPRGLASTGTPCPMTDCNYQTVCVTTKPCNSFRQSGSQKGQCCVSGAEAAELQDVYDDMRCYYERTINDLEQCVSDKQMEFNRIMCEKEECTANERFLKCKLEDVTKMLEQTQQELKDTVQQYSAKTKMMENEICQLSQQVKELTDKNASLSAKLEEAREKAERLAQENCDCNKKITELQCQCDSKDQKIRDLEAYREKAMSLEKQLLEKTQQLMECQLKYQQKDEKCNELLADMEKLKNQLNTLEDKLTQKDKALSDLQSQLDRCKDDWAESQKMITKYQAEIGELKSQNAQIPLLQKQLADCQGSMKEAAELKAQLESLKQKLAECEKLNDSRLAGLKTQVNKGDESCKEQKDEIARLKEQLAALEEENQRSGGLGRECECLKQQNECLVKRMNDLDKILEEKNCVIRENDRRIMCLNRDVQCLRCSLEEHKKTLNCLQEYVTQQNQEKEALKLKVCEFTRVVEQQKECIREKEGTIGQIQSTMQSEQCTVQRCCEQLQIKTVEFCEIQKQLENAYCQIQKQSSMAEQLRCKVCEGQKYVENLSEEVRRLKEELMEKDRKIHDQQCNLKENCKEFDRMAKEIDMHLSASNKQKEGTCHLKCQFEALQREHELLKGRLCEAECRADNASCEAKRLQCELQNRFCSSDKQEKTMHSLQAALATKDEEICYKGQTICELERQLHEAKSQLEEACKLYRSKDNATQDYIVEMQRLERDNQTLKCEIKQREQNEYQLEESLRMMQCNYEKMCCQMKALQDPSNIRSAINYIEKTMADKADTFFCNRSPIEVTNFLKQEISCFQQIFAKSQEDGLAKVAHVLVTKALLEKDECDSQKILEQKDKQIRCLQQEYSKNNCESGQLVQELQSAVHKLECDLKSKTMAYQQLEQAFDRHDSRLYELEKQLTEEKCRYDKLATDKRNSESELMCKVEELTHKIRCTEDELRSKAYTCQQLEKSLEMSECQTQEVQACTVQERRAREDCSRKLQEYQCQVQTKEKQTCELERCLEQSYEQNHRLNQQIEAYCKLESYFERLIAKFMSTTNQLAVKCQADFCSPCPPKCGSESKSYEDFEQRLDFVVGLARNAPEDKQMIDCLRQELLKKDKQMSEMMCCLQQAQAKVNEMQQRVQDLERQLEDACRKLGCASSQLEQEKQNNCQWEKTVAQQDCQLQEMCQLKQMCECLQQKLIDTERQLAYEQENSCRCKDALVEMQKSCRCLSDELKSKDDCCNMLNLQVKRQDCEIKALNDKLRSVQECASFRGRC